MPKFPVDAPKARVLRTLQALGFALVREREHISMLRKNSDGTSTPLTLPNHPQIKLQRFERFARNQESLAKYS